MHWYGDYGIAARHKVVFHALDTEISSVTDEGPVTRVSFADSVVVPDNVQFAEVNVAGINLDDGGVYVSGTGIELGSPFIDVEDPEDALYDALTTNSFGLRVYDCRDDVTGGLWTDDPSHTDGFTTFTDSNGGFQSYMEGWLLIADVNNPAPLIIHDVASATELIIKGDASNLAANGTRFRVLPPPGVCGHGTGSSHTSAGALADARDAGANTTADPGSRYLWAQYYYVPPQAGVWDGDSIEGAQTGPNKQGQYYCWNRTYDVLTARWTTPDPAASPWWNLWDYVYCSPTGAIDPTGLLPLIVVSEDATHGKPAEAIDLGAPPYNGAFNSYTCEVNFAELLRILQRKSNHSPADLKLMVVLSAYASKMSNWEDITMQFDCEDIESGSRYNNKGGHCAKYKEIQAFDNSNAISLEILAHELMHMWQQGTNVFSYLAYLWQIGVNEWLALGLGVYTFDDSHLKGESFDALGYEQQGKIIEWWVQGVILKKKKIYVSGIGEVSVDPPDANWRRIVRIAEQFLGKPHQGD